jgi:hypothetical protein
MTLQPPPPAKPTRPLPWILGGAGVFLTVLVVVVVVARGGGRPAAGESGKPAASATTAASASTAPAPEPAGLGEKVRVGDFQVVVKGVDCSKTKVGKAPLDSTANGKYCLVTVTVTNVGGEELYFNSSDQKIYGDGVAYRNDSIAESWANDDTDPSDVLKPGKSLTGMLVFDVPKETDVDGVILHAEWDTAGVRVKF